MVLDNPVYCGKIAYGRRIKEKIKGTKSEYRQVHTDDYILVAGEHEAIITQELWDKAHRKLKRASNLRQEEEETELIYYQEF